MTGFENVVDSIEKVIGGYDGIVLIVFISGLIRIGFGSASAIQNNRFVWKEFWKGWWMFAITCLSITPFEFVTRFLRDGQDYAILILAMFTGFLLTLFNILKIYGHFVEMSGVGIKKVDDFLIKETKATEKLEEAEDKLNEKNLK